MQRTTTVFEMTAAQMGFDQPIWPEETRYLGVTYTYVNDLISKEGDFDGALYESATPSRYLLFVKEQ